MCVCMWSVRVCESVCVCVCVWQSNDLENVEPLGGDVGVHAGHDAVVAAVVAVLRLHEEQTVLKFLNHLSAVS